MQNINEFIQSNIFLQTVFLENTIFEWLIVLLIFLVALIVLRIFKSIIVAKLKKLSKKTKTEIDDIVIDALDLIHWPFYVFVSAYFSLNFINIPPIIQAWVFYIFLIAVVYYIIKFFERIVDYSIKIVVAKREKKAENAEVIKFLGIVIKIILWAGAVVLILGNMGYNVTSLVAGLGIGGIAVALALQNVLGDLFSSLAIYFDKPFKVGDFIVLGEYKGTVKRVGIKTTRIKALQGEEIIIPNNELTNTKVQNFGVMEKRRIAFNIGVTYDTPASKLKKIPGIIKRIIKERKEAEVDRVHFKSFGDSSLVYEIVYYVNSANYNDYMDVQEEINLNVVREFGKEEIEMAFPTQTLYIKKEEK